eukprot:3940677-Rhodomonas_salina.5
MAISLRACYGMCGTDLAYDGDLPTECATEARCPTLSPYAISLRHLPTPSPYISLRHLHMLSPYAISARSLRTLSPPRLLCDVRANAARTAYYQAAYAATPLVTTRHHPTVEFVRGWAVAGSRRGQGRRAHFPRYDYAPTA